MENLTKPIMVSINGEIRHVRLSKSDSVNSSIDVWEETATNGLDFLGDITCDILVAVINQRSLKCKYGHPIRMNQKRDRKNERRHIPRVISTE